MRLGDGITSSFRRRLTGSILHRSSLIPSGDMRLDIGVAGTAMRLDRGCPQGSLGVDCAISTRDMRLDIGVAGTALRLDRGCPRGSLGVDCAISTRDMRLDSGVQEVKMDLDFKLNEHLGLHWGVPRRVSQGVAHESGVHGRFKALQAVGGREKGGKMQ